MSKRDTTFTVQANEATFLSTELVVPKDRQGDTVANLNYLQILSVLAPYDRFIINTTRAWQHMDILFIDPRQANAAKDYKDCRSHITGQLFRLSDDTQVIPLIRLSYLPNGARFRFVGDSATVQYYKSHEPDTVILVSTGEHLPVNDSRVYVMLCHHDDL